MRFVTGCFIALASAASTAAIVWALSSRLSPSAKAEEKWLEASLADSIVAGRSVLFPAQVDEASLRWATAERLEQAPDVALLASSHGLQISSEYTAPYSVANFGISGGGFPDHMVTVELLLQRGVRPKVWAIFVDPWFFDADLDFLMWRRRAQILVDAETRLAEKHGAPFPRIFRDRVASVVRPQVKQWYSLEPVTASFDRFLNQRFTPVIETKAEDALGTTLLADGSIQPIGGKRDIGVVEARDLALRQFAQNRDRHRYGSFRKVDEQLWTVFTAWIRVLGQEGAQVVFILSPYHPAIFDRILADPKNHLREVEELVRYFAQVSAVPILGSYDPTVAGTSEELFVDGDHLREEGLKRILGKTFVELSAKQNSSVPSSP